MAEDHFWNHDLLLFFHFNGNTVAVVLHRNLRVSVFRCHADIDVFDGSHACSRDGTNVLVAGIDDDFIEDLIQTWIEVKFAPDHFVRTRVVHPPRLLVGFGAADVGVRELQDVLVVSVLLVLSSGHGCSVYGVVSFCLGSAHCQFL